MKKNEKLGQEPAYPCEVGYENGLMLQAHQNGNTTALDNGMSKRFYAACAAMQGLAAMHHSTNDIDNDWIAKTAFNMADKLLEQENL